MNTKLKAGIVVVGAVVFSTIGINASDFFQGVDGSLVGLVSKNNDRPCGTHEIFFQFGGQTLCIDMYEASPHDDCPIMSPQSDVETYTNLNEDRCVPDTKPGVIPWRFVSFTQAQQLCARAGKRLPTNDEWYRVVSGMGDMRGCAVAEGGVPRATGDAKCETPSGIHDMIGNVWEWVDETITDGAYRNRQLPETGYVTLVDAEGIVLETDEVPSLNFGSDYAWINKEGVRGMIRGGFYGSGDDAGMFAQNMAVPLDFKTAGVGFRCVKDIPL